MRNPAFAHGEWARSQPPPPEECGTLLEAHEGVDEALLRAGNHAGATFEELRRFVDAARADSEQQAEVTLRDGSLAVLLGVAAQRSIATGAPVLWEDMLREFGNPEGRSAR